MLNPLVCVFYQYVIKEASSRRSPLCLSDSDKFTKEGSMRSLTCPEFTVWCCSISFVLYDLMICLLLLSICFIFPKTQVLRGTVGHVLSLEGKLEFPSYLPLSLVQYWLGDGRLSSIYTNSPLMPIVMRIRPWTTSPHVCAHAEPGRVRVRAARAHDPCGHECSSIQGLVGPATFLFKFYF